VVAPRGRPLALWLLAGAAAVLAVSGVASNWLTISGTDAPGSWASPGWIAAVRRMRRRKGRYDPALLDAFAGMLGVL